MISHPDFSKRLKKEYDKDCDLEPQIARTLNELARATLGDPREVMSHSQRFKHRVNEMGSRRTDKKNRFV
jgi:Txe/YoeB family toxin of Txe-Axe toxin-antitoxin module